MMNRLTWALLSGLALAGCPSNDAIDTDSTETSAGETGEPLTEVPLDDFYALAEEAFCEWQVACHEYGVEERCAAVNHIEVRLSMQRISGVGNAESVPIDYMREAVEVGRIGYDKKKAAECIAYVRARSCEHPQLHQASEAELAGQAACAEVFVGRMGRNGPCLSASECAETSICGFDPSCMDACCVGACRVLASPVKVGEACPSGGCEEGSYCDFDPNTGLPTTCKQAPGLGKPCAQSGVCSGGAVCDYTDGVEPTCVAPKAPGKPCYDNYECEQPGVCRYDNNTFESECFRPSDEGGPCRFDDGGLQCMRFDNVCTPGNTCELRPGKGDSCQQSQCAGDFFCSETQGYRCTPVADAGEGCGYLPTAFEFIPCSGDNYCNAEFDSGVCIEPVGTASCPVPADAAPAG